jgi:hypothetical protein
MYNQHVLQNCSNAYNYVLMRLIKFRFLTQLGSMTQLFSRMTSRSCDCKNTRHHINIVCCLELPFRLQLQHYLIRHRPLAVELLPNMNGHEVQCFVLIMTMKISPGRHLQIPSLCSGDKLMQVHSEHHLCNT